ncbi:hypothetical protein Hdeb2414_s0007g00260311 [Helianthus debilis subsp. tardiflorus]
MSVLRIRSNCSILQRFIQLCGEPVVENRHILQTMVNRFKSDKDQLDKTQLRGYSCDINFTCMCSPSVINLGLIRVFNWCIFMMLCLCLVLVVNDYFKF